MICLVITNFVIGSWFAWANSVFAQTILDVAERKPHLLFGSGGKPYVVG
jgi:meiotically up-regulated gene 157 (Mug157) protein